MIASKGIVSQTEYQKHLGGNWRTVHGIWEKIKNYVPSYGYSRAEVDALIANMVSSTAVLADHRLLRGDGGARGIQDSGITIDDADNITGIGSILATGSIEIDSAAAAILYLDGHTGSDSYVELQENNVLKWTAGYDQSSGRYKISEGAPGTNTRVEVIAGGSMNVFDTAAAHIQIVAQSSGISRFIADSYTDDAYVELQEQNVLKWCAGYDQTDGSYRISEGAPGTNDRLKIATGGLMTIPGTLELSTVINAGADVNKFLVLDANDYVDYRTGANLLADLSGDAGAAFSWNNQNLTNIGTLSATGITDTAVTATNMAAGTVGERPGGIVGDIRYNSTLGEFEVYIAAWHNMIRSSANVVLGTIGCDEITVADGHGINLQEDITFLGATTENFIAIPDNLPDAFSIKEGANIYQTFITTNGSEGINFNRHIFLTSGYNLSWGGPYGAGIPTIVGVSGANAYWAIYPGGSTSGERFRVDTDGNLGLGQLTFGTNANRVFAQGTGVAPTTSPADCFQMYSADIGAVAGKAGVHWRSEENGIYAWHGGAGTINSFTYQADVADDGSFTLPAITDSAWGFIQAGNNEEYVLFTVDNDGDVILIFNSANVVANADTDTKLCIGTAATQEPLTIRNRLGAQKNINLIIWYS